jgi:oxygen-dependent protoporphyrinogen oxidase
MATTAGAARRILAESCPAAHREVLEATRYASTINLSFRTRWEVLPERTHCFYVPFRESSLVSEFTNEGLKGGNTLRDGWTLVNAGLHDTAARALMETNDRSLFELVSAELARLLPALTEAQPHDLQRWNEAIPKYSSGHLDRVKTFLLNGQGRHGLYLCGDYLNAPWLEGACRCGLKVASELALAARSCAA